MLKAMNALTINGTWEIEELPKGKKTLEYRWVCTMKHRADGTGKRYKARLVAKELPKLLA